MANIKINKASNSKKEGVNKLKTGNMEQESEQWVDNEIRIKWRGQKQSYDACLNKCI